MKSFALATAALFAVVAAKPLQRRDGITVTTTEWVTEYMTVTEIVDISTTLFITPGQSVPTDLTSSIPGPTDGQFFETPSAPPSAPEQTSVAAPPPSSAAPPPPAAPTTTAAPPPPPAPPAPPASSAPPDSSSPAPAPAPPASSSSSPPPPPPPAEPTTTAAPVPAPAPSSSSPAAAPTASAPESSSSAVAKPGGDLTNGPMTWFNLAMGACGTDDSGKDNTDNIVAISHVLMGELSNSNPMCGKTITIYANGKSTQAKIHDKCMGCTSEHIDVSPKVFQDLGIDLGAGKVPVEWTINN